MVSIFHMHAKDWGEHQGYRMRAYIQYVVVNVETVICGDISLPEVKTAEYVVYVKPVRHGADAAGASKKEKKENTKVDIAAAATA